MGQFAISREITSKETCLPDVSKLAQINQAPEFGSLCETPKIGESHGSFSRERLPDVAKHRQIAPALSIDWVGMENLEIPVLDRDETGKAQRVSARVSAFVSLDRVDHRGIHMSRLYTLLRDRLAAEVMEGAHLEQVLEDMLTTQNGLSENCRLEISFDKWRKRRALKSEEWGWRRYPVEIKLEKKGNKLSCLYLFEILYSSTCPASSALARHDLVRRLQGRFGSEDWPAEHVKKWIEDDSNGLATPHAQRSRACIELGFESGAEGLFLSQWNQWIDRAEELLQTPVQAAVRREDEQEFARLNGQNPMFCEDAVRHLFAGLKEWPEIKSLSVRVAHLESLHPHDAVAEMKWP